MDFLERPPNVTGAGDIEDDAADIGLVRQRFRMQLDGDRIADTFRGFDRFLNRCSDGAFRRGNTNWFWMIIAKLNESLNDEATRELQNQ